MKSHGTLKLVHDREGNAHWEVAATPDVMIRVKRLFPRASKYRTGTISVSATTEVARDLEWMLMRWPMEMSESHRGRLIQDAEDHRDTERTVNAILSGDRPHLELMEPAREAREYQLIAADLAITTRHLLLTDELGLGKSMTAILTLRDPLNLPAAVVCPTHLPRQWEDEIAKTLPHLRTHVVRTMTPYDPAKHRSMKGHDPDVMIVPYSKLRGWDDALAGRVRTVIFDEAQELRRAASQKYTSACQIAGQATLTLGLTATPVYNYGGEIYNVLDVIAPGILGTREEFGREWCGGNTTYGPMADKIRVQDPAALGVYLREQGLMLRRTRKDVGRELPDVMRVSHAIESDEEIIEELAGDAVQLAELIVSREAAREELFRASGEFDWKMRHATGVAKAAFVADFVKMLLETDEKVVLFGWHRDVYEIWEDRLKDHRPVFYTGSESPSQKFRSTESFLEGASNLLIMSLRAGSGLDGLQQVCNVCVFGELDWSPGMHDQCIGRLHRDGQEESVLAYFLVADHGADPVIAEVLHLKRQQSEPIQNPDRQLFEQASSDDRVRRLAIEFLKRKRG